MKKITEIYDEYRIMPNLREHMLRVAAVAFFICDNYNVPLQERKIISACLLHDMGNIIKSNLEYFPEFLEPEGLSYWSKIKENYIEKYGKEDHVATIAIAREIGVSGNIIDFLEHIGFSHATKNELEKLPEYKICNYADMRVGPYGVLSLEGRINEAHERYKNRVHSISSGGFDSLSQSLRNIEKQIFSKCKIKPEDITDEAINPIILELQNFVLE